MNNELGGTEEPNHESASHRPSESSCNTSATVFRTRKSVGNSALRRKPCKQHVTAIFKQLRVENRTQAVIVAHKRGPCQSP